MAKPDDDPNRPDGDDSDAPKKAPIDQWLSGELSTLDVIDRFLAFFGIDVESSKRRDKDSDDT